MPDTLRRDLADDFESAVAFLYGPDRLFHDVDESLGKRSAETMRTIRQSVTRRDFETCHWFDARDRLDEIEVPALAVCGEYDGLTPPSYHEYLAANVDDAAFETVLDAAHLAMAERPTAFNGILETFLDRSIER